MKKFIRNHSLAFFLIIFVVLLGVVFFYFNVIRENEQNYNLNHRDIVSIQHFNQSLDYMTFSNNQLRNYTAINKEIEKISPLLKKLKTNILKHYPHNKKLQKNLEAIDRAFDSKVESIEYFKSFDASLNSGSAFLFDLQKEVTHSPTISYKTKSLVNETLFYLFEFYSSQAINEHFVDKNLAQLHHVISNKNSLLLKRFYTQSNALRTTIQSLNTLSKEIKNNQLSKQLKSLLSTLDTQYKNNLKLGRKILFLIFLSTIPTFILFTVVYSRSRKNKKLLQQHASVFAHTQDAIVITDAKERIVSINQAFSDIYGYTLSEIKGKKLNILQSKMKNKQFYKDLWQTLTTQGIYQGRIVNKTKKGEHIPIWVTIQTVHDQSQELINYISVQTDLRMIEASQNKANYLAYHDTLTGLYNRASFEEHLNSALLNSQRNTTKFAVLFIDLDRFKIINDTLGHDVGDKLLINVAKKLQTILRKSDVISRWGGDEFVIILQNIASESFVAAVAQKIVEGLKEPIWVKHHTLNVTVSVGIALYPQNADDAQTLIKYADSAMYQAKDNGKNCFYFYTDALSKEIQERLQIDLALKNALEKDEIYMLFQPQYSLKEQKIISVEALLRWENDTLGFISPDIFIPIAEENRYIIPLGYFIFEESCKSYKRMKEAGVALQRIAINVSTVQFSQENLVDTFLAILARYELQTSEIEIEITERFFMDNTQNTIKILNAFKEHGFAISIDDFGTGYSSMSYLKRLPVDTLKIDKSFVDDVGLGNTLDDAIVNAIAALSKTLHYTIVAEGIETKIQEDFLAKLCCDIGQGFLFSKPLNVEEMLKRFGTPSLYEIET